MDALMPSLECSDMRRRITIDTCSAQGDVSSEAPHGSFTEDDIYKAIADGLIVYDLWNEPLSETHRSQIYRDRSALEFTRSLESPQLLVHPHKYSENALASIAPGSRVTYEGRPYDVVLAGEISVILSGDQGTTEVAISTLQDLYSQRRLIVSGDPATYTAPAERTRDSFSDLSPDDMDRVVQRSRDLDAAKQGSGTESSPRTHRRWKLSVREAGIGLTERIRALAGRIKNRGNRNRKIPDRVVQTLEGFARQYYNQPNSMSIRAAYEKFANECMTSGVRPCSEKTFRTRIREHASTRKRDGSRQAYQEEPIFWYLYANDPIHGVRPWEYVHIDHTKLDLVLICGESGEVLGRPWLSFAIDAESRAVLAFYLSFEPPSFNSCMMVIRDLVRRHGRLPDTIITDNGPEFKSHAFQRLCDLYRINLRYRPKGEPRHGTVCERMFRTADTQFVHNLFGNTKLLKNVRIATKLVSPERHAEWSLPAAYGALDKYFSDLYGTDPHPAHEEPPVAHLRHRLIETGRRLHRLVRFDKVLLIETCPPVDKRGTRTLDSQRGIKVAHLWYWTDAFISCGVAHKDVVVRVDPWDARVCYVELGGKWYQCICNLMVKLRRLTRLELHCYFEEMRKRSGLTKAELTPERLAEWVGVFDKSAFDPRLQRKVAESRIIYEALKLTSVEEDEAVCSTPENSRPRTLKGDIVSGVNEAAEFPVNALEEEVYDTY